MPKQSLIILLVIAIIYLCIQSIFAPFLASYSWLGQSLAMLYAWSPGLVGLYYARKEGISLPIFSKLNKWFYLIPIIALVVAGFGLLVSIPFGAAETINAQLAGRSIGGIIGYLILFLVVGFFFLSILLSFVFLGGELYWRGYFWEKVKQHSPLKMIFLTAFIWSLWQLPSSFFSNRLIGASFAFTFLSVFAFNFILAPVLTFFRLKTGNVMGAAYAYSALVSGFLFYLILFPSTVFRVNITTGGFTLLGLILFSLIFKLYSPSAWKKLV